MGLVWMIFRRDSGQALACSRATCTSWHFDCPTRAVTQNHATSGAERPEQDATCRAFALGLLGEACPWVIRFRRPYWCFWAAGIIAFIYLRDYFSNLVANRLRLCHRFARHQCDPMAFPGVIDMLPGDFSDAQTQGPLWASGIFSFVRRSLRIAGQRRLLSSRRRSRRLILLATGGRDHWVTEAT